MTTEGPTASAKSMKQGRGAVLICDALGFRGVWRGGHERVVEALGMADGLLKTVAGQWSNQEGTRLDQESLSYAFSDTLAFATWCVVDPRDPQRVEEAEELAVDACAFAASLLQSMICMSRFPLAYRGAIASGTFVAHGEFLVGEAVDEAADHMSVPNAAMIRLTPSARRAIERQRARRQRGYWHFLFERGGTLMDRLISGALGGEPEDVESAVVKVAMPTKAHGSVESYVVDPLRYCEPDRIRDVSDALLDTFSRGSPDVSVEVKRDHTAAFLVEMKARAAKRNEENIGQAENQ